MFNSKFIPSATQTFITHPFYFFISNHFHTSTTNPCSTPNIIPQSAIYNKNTKNFHHPKSHQIVSLKISNSNEPQHTISISTPNSYSTKHMIILKSPLSSKDKAWPSKISSKPLQTQEDSLNLLKSSKPKKLINYFKSTEKKQSQTVSLQHLSLPNFATTSSKISNSPKPIATLKLPKTILANPCTKKVPVWANSIWGKTSSHKKSLQNKSDSTLSTNNPESSLKIWSLQREFTT